MNLKCTYTGTYFFPNDVFVKLEIKHLLPLDFMELINGMFLYLCMNYRLFYSNNFIKINFTLDFFESKIIEHLRDRFLVFGLIHAMKTLLLVFLYLYRPIQDSLKQMNFFQHLIIRNFGSNGRILKIKTFISATNCVTIGNRLFYFQTKQKHVASM